MPRKPPTATLTPAELNHVIARLQYLQKARRTYIRGQARLDRATESTIASDRGYRADLPEAERKRLSAEAIKFRKGIEEAMLRSVTPDNPGIDDTIFVLVCTFFNARRPLDLKRGEVEDEMRDYARMLPVWPWVRDNVSGLAELGLAVLVAESVRKNGDHIGQYSGPAGLWKRLGLACMDGHRQGMVPKDITGEERKTAWVKRGYNPQRRAEVFAFVDDMLLRQQWRGARDANGKNPAISKQPIAVEAHPIGPYGEVYGTRKAWNTARGLNLAHADKEARRFMAKRVIRDLWIAWQHTDAALATDMAKAA